MAFVSNLWTYFSTPVKVEEKQITCEEEDEILRRAENILRIRKEKAEQEQIVVKLLKRRRQRRGSQKNRMNQECQK